MCTERQRETVLLALREKLNKKGYFSPLCKQLAASHACTINGHLIGNNHFYLSKFKIRSCPWNKQLLVKPSGNIAWMFEDVPDQCLQEVVHTWTFHTQLLAHTCRSFSKFISSAKGFTVLSLQVHVMHKSACTTLIYRCPIVDSYTYWQLRLLLSITFNYNYKVFLLRWLNLMMWNWILRSLWFEYLENT